MSSVTVLALVFLAIAVAFPLFAEHVGRIRNRRAAHAHFDALHAEIDARLARQHEEWARRYTPVSTEELVAEGYAHPDSLSFDPKG